MRTARNHSEETAADGSTPIVAEEQKDKTKRIRYPYAEKIDFVRFTGELDGLAEAPKDAKGKLVSQKMIEVAKRSQFFANQKGDKYKIIMVYRGRGNNKRQQLFDLIRKNDKNKVAFFKEKGIIL